MDWKHGMASGLDKWKETQRERKGFHRQLCVFGSGPQRHLGFSTLIRNPNYNVTFVTNCIKVETGYIDVVFKNEKISLVWFHSHPSNLASHVFGRAMCWEGAAIKLGDVCD